MKIIAVAGYKNSGKTFLVERLITELEKHGRVGTVKHLHRHDLNPAGTDTGRHMDAGASVVMAVTSSGTAKFTSQTSLESALDALADSGMDYAVVEGFKDSMLPKIVLGDLDVPNAVMRFDTYPTNDDMAPLISLIKQQPEYHTLNSLIARVKQQPGIKKVGAIGSFTGIVRQQTADVETTELEFESYQDVAEDRIRKIQDDLKGREGVIDVVIHHRTGRIGPGEDIVYIVVAAAHRQQLFPALSDAIDRVKAEVPIWKKEHCTSGEFWVHDHP